MKNMKKNKKAFTLTEILVVIVIIGIVLLIAVPSIMAINRSVKKRELETKKSALVSAAETYAKNNISEFGGGTIMQIPVRTLLYYGYVTSDKECDEPIGCVINPITEESMNDEIITVKRNMSITQATWGGETGNSYTATFVAQGSGCTTSSATLGCEANTYCEVKAPSITRDGFEILGWSKNASSNYAEYEVGEKIQLTTNETYYAITRKDVIVTFNANGGIVSDGDSLEDNCSYYNTSVGCKVTAPRVSKSGNVLSGWYTSASGGSSININSVSNSLTAYAQWSACPAGQYLAIGATACSNCTGNTYTDTAGQTSCTPCAAGTIPNSTHTGCTACPAGQYATAGATACSNCTGNTYTSSAGQTSCTSCGTGYTVNSTHTGCSANVVAIRYNGNGGTWAASSSSSYSSNSDGYVMKSGSIYEQKGNYGSVVNSSSGLLNYNSVNYVKFAKGGYVAPDGKEWYIKNGSTKTYFDHDDTSVTSIAVAAAGGCTLANGSCTVTAYVNWTACPAGQYAAAGDATCSACTGNTYTSSAGKSSCTACPSGQTANSTHTGCTTTSTCSCDMYCYRGMTVDCYYAPGPGETSNFHYGPAVNVCWCKAAVPNVTCSNFAQTVCNGHGGTREFLYKTTSGTCTRTEKNC